MQVIRVIRIRRPGNHLNHVRDLTLTPHIHTAESFGLGVSGASFQNTKNL